MSTMPRVTHSPALLNMPRSRPLLLAAGAVFIFFVTFYAFGPSTSLYNSHDSHSSHDNIGASTKVAPENPANASVTRGFHLLTTATKNDVNVCRLVASAAILSYPPTVLLAWQGKGDYDAAETHIAKLRAPLRYFEKLPSSSDDDLVLLIDGYDVIFQLGPDVLLQRYDEVIKASNARLERQFSAEHLKEHDMRTTILFGPDVFCFPIDFRRPACWIVPESTLPRDAFGSETDKNDDHRRPRWLNSGTIIGPVKDLRRLFQAALARVEETWDPDFSGRNSDQMYIADLWAEQEFVRMTSTGENASIPLPDQVPDDIKPEIITPAPENRKDAELHIGIDYESRMFQTVALFYDILQWATFDHSQYFLTKDMKHQFSLQLPQDVEASRPPYGALDDGGLGNTWLKQKSWKDVPLGINTVTKNMFPIIHFTGIKEYRDPWWDRMWFFSHVEKLLKAEPDRGIITTIGGVNWVPYLPFGKDSARQDAWADQGELLGWKRLCGEHESSLFHGWRPNWKQEAKEREGEKKEEEKKEDESKEEEKQEDKNKAGEEQKEANNNNNNKQEQHKNER